MKIYPFSMSAFKNKEELYKSKAKFYEDAYIEAYDSLQVERVKLDNTINTLENMLEDLS